MDGNAKINLILELKDRLKTGFTKAKNTVNQSVGLMKDKIGAFKLSAISNIKSVAKEVPIIGRAFELIKNPIVLATAAIIGMSVLIGNLTKKAAEFEHAFLPIKQLNLDKSSAQLKGYQNDIKNAAFEVGANLIDSTNAMYDLQSGTGLFGKEAIDVFKKVGEYSLVTGANINDSTNSVIKAMKAFGLGVKDIDGLLASNAKTVQQGIVTFDELARVQTEYAGAAAVAGQSVDTANKLFAAFTSIAKDATTGATMTKTAFQGLTQKQTIQGLKEMGVSMYNSNGEMRDMASILKDVSARFKTMDSKAIDAVINNIGGPEGLRAMFGKLKTDSAGFFESMENFDKTEFNFAKAMKNAKNDATILAQMAKNRRDIVAVEIGQKFLPIWVTILEKVNGLLSFVWKNFDTIWSVIRNVVIGLGAVKLAMIAVNIVMGANPVGAIIIGVMLLITGITLLVKKTEGWAESWKAVKTIVTTIFKQLGLNFMFNFQTIAFGIQYIYLKFKSLGQWLQGFFGNIGKAIALAFKGDFTGAKQALKAKITTQAGEDIKQLESEYKAKAQNFVSQTKANALAIQEASKMIGIRRKRDDEAEASTANASGAGNPLSASGEGSVNPAGVPVDTSIDKITGSAKQVKNIVINIDSFNKGGINTQNTNLQHMDATQLEQWFNDMMLRVIRNVELSY